MADTSKPRTARRGADDSSNALTTPSGSSDAAQLVVRSYDQDVSFWTRFRSRFRSSPLLVAGLALVLMPLTLLWTGEPPVDLTDYAERTRRVLKSTPLIDGHNDLPWQLRIEMHNRIYEGPDFGQLLLGHTDIQRLRQGMVGGQFWSVYVDCDANQKHFEDPSWIVRDTLEQIDVTKRFIQQHPAHLQFCDQAACVAEAFGAGRIASMIGIEGGHQVGGSLASLRQVYELGARYLTLTHNCDNAFATSTSTVAAAAGGQAAEVDGGLKPLGYDAVREMNRLGMMVDLSHVSHRTMRDVLRVARAPVIFSHSGAYAVEPHLRHVPDDVLRAVRDNGGIVMAVFVNRFLNMRHPERATIHDVADHIWHIAEVCGWHCVGLGSDFSGTPHVPIGLEDVSKFPDLVQLLMQRGATDAQIRLLAGENLVRVWFAVEHAARQIQAAGELPSEAEFHDRAWHLGLVDAPWMLRGSREKAAAAGAAAKPFMFSVDEDGKHNPVKRV